ncbi:fimbrial protein [Pseudomonas muyukensis]|uniref:Type 1 fimbrial protein n=1 Tax=Pseudomonas muyukensis TaxID=2842357 RepID=A0ABX8M5A9_9PSED|nr:fimbrial protein [Pseudomonas muyukensis]QXH33673.1 type 1 fimbrial protein [Pseudomonas muyukensis]
MKNKSARFNRLTITLLYLFAGLATHAQAFTVTAAGATIEGDMIRYNFIISDWSTFDSSRGVCEQEPGVTTCNIHTGTWRYSTGVGTGAFPTSGTRSWRIPTRSGSTLGSMLTDLQKEGFYVPLRTSIVIPASVDVSDACAGLTSSRTGPSIGGGIGKFGPCLRLANMKPPAPTCETPDVKVELGDYSTRDFPRYGDFTLPKAFNLLMNNCTTTVKKVSYTLSANPTAPAVNAAQGIVALNSASTAKGIALQLLDSNQNPIQLDKNYSFNELTAGGGNFSIPLNARYIRTLPNAGAGTQDKGVTGGTANTEVTFIMSYL